MFLMHYFSPIIVFYFLRDKIIFFGLILGNLIDLDHVYYRIIGKVEWFESACIDGLGSQCSIGFYPLHNLYVFLIVIILAILFFLISLYYKNKKIRFLYWLAIGVIIHLILDFTHLLTGFGI